MSGVKEIANLRILEEPVVIAHEQQTRKKTKNRMEK
jgi:hypothetical protein